MDAARLFGIFLTLTLFLTTLLNCSNVIRESRYARKDISDVSMRNTIAVLYSVTNNRQCAMKCSLKSNCTVFVYSGSKRVCQLGFSAVYLRNISYMPDYQLFMSNTDYFTDFNCSSTHFVTVVCSVNTTLPISVVKLVQYSNSACVPETTYGLTPGNQFWVGSGCRALFRARVR